MAELVGDPESEVLFLKERSPINYINEINPITKLLVIQGAKDPRVPKGESDQIVELLRNKNMSVEYVVFEDEGHGFTKFSNHIKALKQSAGFFINGL